MRLYSLLFVAVLYACSLTSSTRSISTSVGSLNSNKRDNSADPIKVETIKEERAFDFSAFTHAFNTVGTMSSKFAEELMFKILTKHVNNAMEAYAFLRPFNNDWLRNIWSAVWLKYLETAPALTKEATMNFLSHQRNDWIVEMLDALTEAKVNGDMMKVYEDQLIEHWLAQKKTPEDVFKTFKLNGRLEPYSSVELERLKVWIWFTQKQIDRPISISCSTYNFRDRVNILDGLRWFGDEYNVKLMETQLAKSLQTRNGPYDTEVIQVFKDLKLDGTLDKLFDHPNLNVFNNYARKFVPEHPLIETLIRASFKVFGGPALYRKLYALKNKRVMNVQPLVDELGRQWESNQIRFFVES